MVWRVLFERLLKSLGLSILSRRSSPPLHSNNNTKKKKEKEEEEEVLLGEEDPSLASMFPRLLSSPRRSEAVFLTRCRSRLSWHHPSSPNSFQPKAKPIPKRLPLLLLLHMCLRPPSPPRRSTPSAAPFR